MPKVAKPKVVYEHQPCHLAALVFPCPLPDPHKGKRCMWKCDRGNCHHFYVFGTIIESCFEEERKKKQKEAA